MRINERLAGLRTTDKLTLKDLRDRIEERTGALHHRTSTGNAQASGGCLRSHSPGVTSASRGSDIRG
jgi:hypothetical protein